MRPNKQDSQLITSIDGELYYLPGFLSVAESDQLFEKFKEELPWRQDKISMFGKTHDLPRLQVWYGDQGTSYTYSKMKLEPLPWREDLLELKKKVESMLSEDFNSVLVNYYRDGSDQNGWHADNEKELGINPAIASLTLGECRKFSLKHKRNKDLKIDLWPEKGSLILMKGPFQDNWLHTIPRSKKVSAGRINLTFRKIILD